MCGRFTLKTPAPEIAAVFDLDAPPPFDLAPRFNIAPSQEVLIVRVPAARARRQASLARWGFEPGLLLARRESVFSRPAFRDAARRRRCLVPADGFYEWREVGGHKVPYYFRMRDRRPFAMAGLLDSDSAACVILTQDANPAVAAVHDRMPVILSPSAWPSWLDPATRDAPALRPLLEAAPAASADLRGHPVSPRVNRPENDDARCIEPAPSGLLF